MKKILLTLVLAYASIFIATDAKTNEPLLTRCHVLKRLRTAVTKKLQELDTEAAEGDIASAESLYFISRICNGDTFYAWGKTKEKLREIGFVNDKGYASISLCDCLSEEAYEECKDVFEEDKNKSQE